MKFIIAIINAAFLKSKDIPDVKWETVLRIGIILLLLTLLFLFIKQII